MCYISLALTVSIYSLQWNDILFRLFRLSLHGKLLISQEFWIHALSGRVSLLLWLFYAIPVGLPGLVVSGVVLQVARLLESALREKLLVHEYVTIIVINLTKCCLPPIDHGRHGRHGDTKDGGRYH